MIPARTTAPATLNPKLPTSKSSAANWAVCVKSVLVNADDIEAAASNPSTSAWRGVDLIGRRPPRRAFGVVVGGRSDRDGVGAEAEESPHREREQPAEPRDRAAGTGCARRAARRRSVTRRSYVRERPSELVERAVAPTAPRSAGRDAGASSRLRTCWVVRPLPRHRPSAAQHGAEHTDAREIRARRRRLLHHRSSRRAARGRGGRAGRQELGAEADGCEPDGRRRVRDHQRAGDRGRRHHVGAARRDRARRSPGPTTTR